jgi:hypothetical protein
MSLISAGSISLDSIFLLIGSGSGSLRRFRKILLSNIINQCCRSGSGQIRNIKRIRGRIRKKSFRIRAKISWICNNDEELDILSGELGSIS